VLVGAEAGNGVDDKRKKRRFDLSGKKRKIESDTSQSTYLDLTIDM
jgi:hypothetical protein